MERREAATIARRLEIFSLCTLLNLESEMEREINANTQMSNAAMSLTVMCKTVKDRVLGENQ